MKNGMLTPRNSIVIREMSRTSWQMGKHLMNGDLENHSKGQHFLLEQWLNMTRFHHVICQDFIKLARKFYQESFLGAH